MSAPLRIETKLPLVAIGTGVALAIGAYFGLQSRVDLLESRAKLTEVQLDKQDDTNKEILVTLGSVEKTMVAVNGRLEKIEYRIAELEKRVARLDRLP